MEIFESFFYEFPPFKMRSRKYLSLFACASLSTSFAQLTAKGPHEARRRHIIVIKEDISGDKDTAPITSTEVESEYPVSPNSRCGFATGE